MGESNPVQDDDELTEDIRSIIAFLRVLVVASADNPGLTHDARTAGCATGGSIGGTCTAGITSCPTAGTSCADGLATGGSGGRKCVTCDCTGIATGGSSDGTCTAAGNPCAAGLATGGRTCIGPAACSSLVGR
ncbi:Hypothetical Protein FCC1311_112652 [Hondaea fermentalgiana]|uniref:Uncharacterized protein n=1 Tax=Hondaea fermentalgiana TaxID=2315210 RepID=A0A2R5GW24_9STRA|nr:Hypothetical Protein FCC1311_112652 [Hondaea fermentalgiana]|eukprot:GBG35042.1 Hypothetical Protein FCC1311_112652 [Hondaea fermentalgiana]